MDSYERAYHFGKALGRALLNPLLVAYLIYEEVATHWKYFWAGFTQQGED